MIMKKVEGKCYEKKRKKFIDIKKANSVRQTPVGVTPLSPLLAAGRAA